MLATAITVIISLWLDGFVKWQYVAHKGIVGVVIGWLWYQDGINALHSSMVSVIMSDVAGE